MTDHTVDQWYDRHERVWITTIRDENGYQIGDAMIDGRKMDAAVSKRIMQARIEDEDR